MPAPPPDADYIRRWFTANRYRLTGNGVYFQGGETNTQPPEESAGSRLKVLIARLSPYHSVASSMSHGLLGALAREIPGIFVDYAFLPPGKDLPLFQEAGVPLWTGLTTKEPPHRFDLIAISNAVSFELLNLPLLLNHSGLALSHQARMEDPAHPLVLLGGSNSPNTALLHGSWGNNEAGLVDGVAVGEGEDLWPEFLRRMLAFPGARERKEAFLDSLLGLAGIYLPHRYEHRYKDGHLVEIVPASPAVPFPVRAAFPRNFSAPPPLHLLPIPHDGEAAGTLSLEIDRGCGYFCRFCQEGHGHRPRRERPARALIGAALAAKGTLGADRVNLSSFNFNAYSELFPLLAGLRAHFRHVLAKSERLDLLAGGRGPNRLDDYLDKKSVSLGIEGISARLRKKLCKNLPEVLLRDGIFRLLSEGGGQLKLFFLYTGWETAEDLEEFRDFLHFVEGLAARLPRHGQIILSFSPLVALPFTPLQWATAPRAGEISPERLEAVSRRPHLVFRWAFPPASRVLAQLLTTGDRRLTPILVRASLERQLLYYGELSSAWIRPWLELMAEAGLQPDDFFKEAPVLPWDDLSGPESREWLEEQHQLALADEEEETPPCQPRPGEPGSCAACGACSDPGQRQATVSRPLSDPLASPLPATRGPHETLLVALPVTPEQAFLPSRVLATLAAREILRFRPDLASRYSSPGPRLGDFTLPLYGQVPVLLLFSAGTSPLLPAQETPGPLSWRWVKEGLALRQLSLAIDFTPAPMPEAEIERSFRNLPSTPLRLTRKKTPAGWDLVPEGARAAKSQVLSASWKSPLLTMRLGTRFPLEAWLTRMGREPGRLLPIRLLEAVLE